MMQMDIGEVRDVIVAGWAGRNPADVQHHIAELEMLGVAPPSTVPLFYRVSADILTQAENIVVVGEQTSGEAEPVLLRTATGLYVGIGSDHTDRFCENFSVALSKQVCPKVVGTCFWRYEDVIGHWDELRLRSYRHEGAQRILYQEGPLASLLRPEKLMHEAPMHDGDGLLAPGALMFCGTVPAIGGILPTPELTIELVDPVLGHVLSHRYSVTTLPVVA
ncbi:DUF2848 domain-containing protein [Komagataeibacter nataicola]|uniref:DUF2848 domain-containing protein n=1 Tax=Komagataeibacter nataicola TaxID=265960 RepID=UPI0023DD2CC5|nr:DUF2848 domain-containing protein [Komagataeibacter nataicola]WEQ54486.1 DUF2848 domain-containing protein [Komagataeibacter nataicola]